MTYATTGVTQARAARIAGAMFLFVNALGIYAEVFVRGSLLRGNAAHVAENIIGNERLYRFAIVNDLVAFAGTIVLIWALYVLLRPVNRDFALLALLLRVIENAIMATVTLGSLVAVRVLSGAEFLEIFEPDQLHALSRLSRNVFGYGQDVAFIFLGLGSAIFAYLLLKSCYVPRVLAGWGIFASLALASYNVVIIVYPELVNTLMYVAFAPMGIYEIGIGFWLLIKGAKLPADSGHAT